LEIGVAFALFHRWVDSKATETPSMPTISPNTSNKDFEIDILFHAVQSSGNYAVEEDTPPTVFRARVTSYILEANEVSIEIFVVET
jgi:hypothetical protein